MLSCSLDPDQDLQSGSKLVTWYDVCCNMRGGGVGEISSRGDYVLVVKFTRRDYVLVVKFMGGILSTYTKMSRGGFVRGGLCLYPDNGHKTPAFKVDKLPCFTCFNLYECVLHNNSLMIKL